MRIIKVTDNGRRIYRHNGINFSLERDTANDVLESQDALRQLADDIKFIEQRLWSNEHEDWMGVCDDPTEYVEGIERDLHVLTLCTEEEQHNDYF